MDPKPIYNGLAGMAALLLIFFGAVSLISGFEFALDQFSRFWFYLIALAFGFGVQLALYSYLRRAIAGGSKAVLAASGGTSTVAMISCCTHYLANLLPVIATSGIAGFVGQYQVEFFWVGLVLNAAGIAFVGHRLNSFAQGSSDPVAKWYVRVAAAATVFLLSIALAGAAGSGGRPQSSDAPAGQQPTPTVQPQDVTVQELPEISKTFEGVEYAVTPFKEGGTWKFRVTMNTHSGSLDIDMVRNAFLTASGEMYVSPIWEGDPPGGHHRSGILTFHEPPEEFERASDLTLDTADYLTFEIIIRKGIEPLTFSWKDVR